jgi:hypothetical protein
MSSNKYKYSNDGKTYKFRDELVVSKSVSQFKDVASFTEVPYLNNNHAELNSGQFGLEIQRDLAYGSCIYVSEGENANGAYFLREELIKARKTPILKPVDIEHNPEIIVGVMYDSALMTQRGLLIKEEDIVYNDIAERHYILDENKNENTDKLDIKTNFVLYKYMFPQVVDELSRHQFNEKNSKYYVSMEVFYNDFGYIFNNDESTLVRVKNNLEGKELYARYEKCVNRLAPDGRHVSKVYFNFTFGGVGIVEQPANKRSYLLDLAIKNNSSAVVDSVTSGMDKHTHTNFENDENLLQGEEMLETKDKAAIDKLVTEAMTANPEIKADTARIGVLEKRIEDLTKDNADLKVKFDSATDTVDVLSTKAETISSTLSETESKFAQDLAGKESEIQKLKEDLAKAVDELTSIKQEKVGLDRIVELETAGVKFGERKDDVLSRISKMSDVDFASYKEDMLSVLSSIAAKAAEMTDEEKKAMEEKKALEDKKLKAAKDEEDKPCAKKEKASDEDGEGDEDSDGGEEEKHVDLTVDMASAEAFNTATASSSNVDLNKNLEQAALQAFAQITTRSKTKPRGDNTIF